MKPDRRAGAGPGGPPRKAAPSSQRKPPARPSAAAAAIAVAAEEERRLRQRNRLTLEEDKPAVERCLEELVFGDVEDDEDALLRRLQGSRVREAAARGLGALGRGARWAVSLWGRSLGDLRRRERSGRRAPENAGADEGYQTGSLRWAETSPFSAPGGSPCAWYPAGALHVRVANCSRDQFSRLGPTVLPPNSVFSSWPFDLLHQYLAVIRELRNRNVRFKTRQLLRMDCVCLFTRSLFVCWGPHIFSGSENPSCFLSSLLDIFNHFFGTLLIISFMLCLIFL